MKNISEVALKKAEKILSEFNKELQKNGFTEKIEPFLNLAWKGSEIFKTYKKHLKSVKFKVEVKDYKFTGFDHKTKIFSFLENINGEETTIFVQPLFNIGYPSENGEYGVIPVKLVKFFVYGETEAEEEIEAKTNFDIQNDIDTNEVKESVSKKQIEEKDSLRNIEVRY
jgi:hypothetical protein